MSEAVIESCSMHKKSITGMCLYTNGWCEGYQKSKCDDSPCDECAECQYNQFYEAQEGKNDMMGIRCGGDMHDWHVLDAELHDEGWSLQILHSHNQWLIFYGHQAYLPASGKADNLQDAIIQAYHKIRERD